MLLHVRCVILFLCVLSAATIAEAQDPFRQVIDVDSWGAPDGIGKGDHPQCFVWQDQQGWHVHTDTGGKRHEFNITIETVGGRVLSLENFSALDGKKKGKRQQDRGKISEDRRTITAKFVTSIKTDGIDFTVDANTSVLRFRLLVNGEERPQWIALGAGKVSPQTAAFALAKRKK
jgi:hypothetical protein